MKPKLTLYPVYAYSKNEHFTNRIYLIECSQKFEVGIRASRASVSTQFRVLFIIIYLFNIIYTR